MTRTFDFHQTQNLFLLRQLGHFQVVNNGGEEMKAGLRGLQRFSQVDIGGAITLCYAPAPTHLAEVE